MPTKIEWSDETWNPIVGCDKVSDGCRNCYAIDTAYRLEHAFKQPAYAGTTRKLADGSRNWTGLVRCLPERLADPLKWRQPKRIFVNSMADLFHEDVPDEFVDKVFAVMALTERHAYQVLTKRPARMQRWAADPETPRRIGLFMTAGTILMSPGTINADGGTMADWHKAGVRWPLPNVWLGVSVEDQRAADERIPLLLQTFAAVRWLSCEPLIGPVDLHAWLPYYTACGASRDPETVAALDDMFRAAVRMLRRDGSAGIDWVVAGGESGAHYRPCDPDWVRSLRDQCQATGTPFYFKQVGGRTHAAGGRVLDGRTWDEYPESPR